MRAISRRTPSKPERITAFGVSSMMKSTPVRCSSARMLRPSRPMMRPFMSSAESWTTETVVSAAWPAASRCMTTERMLRTRRSASRLVSSSIWRTILARSWRVWSSTSLSSCWRACEAGMPATRSSSRRWCSRACSSSAALPTSTRSRSPSSTRRLSTASSRARSRSSSRSRSARRSALLPSSVSWRRRAPRRPPARGASGHPRLRRRWTAAKPRDAARQQRRRGHEPDREADGHHDRANQDFHDVFSPTGRNRDPGPALVFSIS